MAQHDYSIANQTFPNTRTDINNALTAIATNNSGDTAPSTTFANQWWYETDTNKLYIRNEDNDAFIHILTLNQTNDTVTSVEGGAVLTGIDDQSSSNDDQITINDNAVIINEDSDDLDFRVETNGGTHTFFVNGGNNTVQIGRADSDGVANVKLQVEAVDSSSGISAHRASADTSGPALYLSSSRGASLGDDTVVQDGDDLGSIAWFGADGTDRNSPAASISGQVDGTPGSNDMPGRIVFKTTLDGGVTQHERMRITNAGSVGIGESANIDAKLHVTSADSGGTFHSQADEIGLEGSGHSGLNLLSGSSSQGSIYFGDSEDNNAGRVVYDNSTNSMIIFSNASESLRMSTSQVLSTGAEAGPDTTNGGLTIQTNAEDGSAFTLKNTDIAHGMTDNGQTDTYFFMKKGNPTEGGVYMQGFSESGSPAIRMTGATTSASTGEGTTVEGSINLEGSLKSGNSIDVHGADDNILIVRNHGSTQFIVKGDGELFSNQSATVGTFDAYEDAQLVRAYDLNHMQGVINSKFDKFVQYNKDDLQKARLIGTDNDGNATSFVSITGMQRLHNGAIWQQYEKTERLTNAMYELAKATVGEDKANEILEQNEIKLLN